MSTVIYVRPEDEALLFTTIKYMARKNSDSGLHNSASILREYAAVIKEQMEEE